MRKYINKSLAVISALFLLISCGDFEEINIDPNRPSEVPTSGMLTQAQANLIYNFNGEVGQLGAQYAQYFAQLDYPEKSNYLDDGESEFSSAYLGGLRDLQEIIRLNQSDLNKEYVKQFGDHENQIAVAKILQAWAFHNITDVWGDVPFSQAVGRSGANISPAYDAQEDIYDGIITLLDEAIAGINETPLVSLKGDWIFDGNMTNWKALANSLKLRVAMRLSEVDNTKADNLIDDAIFAEAFSTSSDVALFTHLSSNNEANPLYIDNFVNGGGDYFGLANTLVDRMNANNDPRLAAYAKLAVNTNTYVGLTYGDPAGGSDLDISMPGDMYGGATAPSIIMTAAEVLFIKAEAAARGYISGGQTSAEQYYYDAITASLEYNGASAGEISAYLAEPGVAYNAANWMESIGNQKWIALYGQGIQGWAEWRRLGFPNLLPGAGATAGVEIPTRRAYPSSEYATNNANVTAAVDRLPGKTDTFSEKIWWDQ